MRIVLVFLIACGGSQPQPSQPGSATPIAATPPSEAPRSRCGKSVASLVDKTREGMVSDGFNDTAIAKVRTSATESCEQKQWSAAVLDCYDSATTVQAIGQCQDKLSEDQRTDLQQRMNAIAKEQSR